MKFKRLEVSGFKSFADKLEVKFGPGITGIVGPNGCGKSNVADSVRWVLGEQSAKLLRGSSMQDVIFNGTDRRKSLSFCEVSLHFDNGADPETGAKLFPDLDYKEVVIARKLYRSGESEYLINKQVCRLKDVTELLRDGGMGREGYSIIGQGRIDELLSAKPEDRRAIFEEAAGISKFKAKKIESERKLNRTCENLTRVDDILAEKSKQLEPLTRQSENARKWLALRDKLRGHEINTYIYQYDTANEAKQVIGARLNGVLEELDLRNRESEQAAAESNEAMANIASSDRSIEALREELLELTVGIEREAGEIKLLNERLGYLTEQSAQIAGESRKAEAEHVDTLKLIEEGQDAALKRAAELEEKRAEFETLATAYLAVAEELMRGEDAADKRHSEIVDALDRLADLKANMERLKAEKEALVSSVGDLKKRIDFFNDRLTVDSDEAERFKTVIDGLAAEKNALASACDETRKFHNEALARVRDCASKLDKLSAEYHTQRSRRKMFVEMREANEAFGYSVKKLLADAKDNPALSGRIEGVVAQLVKVKPGFETAVETALGNAVQNIVTKTEAEAKYLIAYLKEKRYGQITFLPVNTFKPRLIDPRFHALYNEEGCLGPAIDCIGYDPVYTPIFRGLLGGTVFARDMDSAVRLAQKSGYGFKIVTLEGDVIQTSGSLTGGSKKSELTNIFGYEREIETLTARVAELEKETAALTALRDEKAAEQAESAKTLSEFGDRMHAIDIELAAKNETYGALKDAIRSGTVSVANLEFEVLNATERVETIDRDLNSVAELEALVSGERFAADETGKEQRQKFEALRAERDRLHELRIGAQMTVTTLENDLKNFEADIKRLQSNAFALAERIGYNHERLSENKEIAERIERELTAFSAQSKEGDTERVKEIRRTLANLDEFKQGMQEKLSVIDARRAALLEEIQTVHGKKAKEEQLLLKVDADIEYMETRIAEEYELTYEVCLPFKEDGYNVHEGGQEIARLKRQMQSLGHVNLDAIDECKRVYEEYHELNIQREDIFKAKTDLEKIIADLNKEMLSRFTEQFERIRSNFVVIFRELFNGGTADLLLLEDENPLEAGIEIVAQPPEKKLQTITLLSGGERALTAIAILFAILRLRPMPFCILDEIEAALDDANATRFAKYLRRFAEGTQFIVITHRKPTMELADALYGVTMEEKGVSKIVSVKLSEASAMADTGAREK